MIFDAATGLRGTLVADGERVPFAFWGNTDTGEWKAHCLAPDGKPLRKDDGSPVVRKGKALWLQFVQGTIPPHRLTTYEESRGEYIEVFKHIWRDRGFSPLDVQKRLEAKQRRERSLGGY